MSYLRDEIDALDAAEAKLRAASPAEAMAVEPRAKSGPVAGFARDRLTGRAWLTFASRPGDAAVALLKSAGWRWSGRRGAWHNNRRFVRPPEGIPYEDEGEVEYAAERAEMLEERADRRAGASAAAYAKAERVASGIPMGQPILVGHHSEKRHRRDLARISRGYAKAGELDSEARRLAASASSSQRHQAHLESPGTIQRRLDRLRADLRSLERREKEWGASGSVEWLQRVADVRSEVERVERLLAEAGGPVEVPEVGPGDIVRIKGWKIRVTRANPKSISGEIMEGGAAGMTGKWDRSHFQGIIEKAPPKAAAPRSRKSPTTTDRDRDRLEKQVWTATPAFARGPWRGDRSIMRGGYSIALRTLTDDELRMLIDPVMQGKVGDLLAQWSRRPR